MLSRRLAMKQWRQGGTAWPAKVSYHKTIDFLFDKTSQSLGTCSSSEAHAPDVPLGSVLGFAILPAEYVLNPFPM
jgi:hypothetical protein